MRAARLLAVLCVVALAGCAAAPEPAPRPVTDETIGGKFSTSPAGTVVAGTQLPSDSTDFRSNLMRDMQPISGPGCVPGRGVFQRGDLICPGQGG